MIITDQSFLERKERIILSTIDLMNEYGTQSVSTKKIAVREGITEAAIFKHFPKKDDLLLAVLDYFTKYDNDIYESAKLREMSPFEAITFYVDMYSSYYQSYPAITVILTSLSEIKYNSNLAEKVQNIIEIRKSFFREYIKKAQENNEIPIGMNSDILVDVFLGTMNEICFEWRMSGFSFSLKEKCVSAVQLLIYSFQVNRKDGYNYD